MPAAALENHIVFQIRDEWDAGIINVREWANMLELSPETIRRIGRRDTYRGLDRPGAQGLDRRLSRSRGPEKEGFEIPPDEINESLRRLMEKL